MLGLIIKPNQLCIIDEYMPVGNYFINPDNWREMRIMFPFYVLTWILVSSEYYVDH
jgi:hypothetical protein